MKLVALPPALHAANEALAFGIELVMLVAFAAWGASLGNGAVTKWLAAAAVPLAVATVWGLLLAPKARVRLPVAGAVALKAGLFAGAAVAIDGSGRPALAVAFAEVALINTAVAAVDRMQRDPSPRA
ncbi:MAG: YrdB family protein [Polyangiaceae bacterium]|nr:YrdB family protein [Polyangiaceae bacterium]